MRDHHCAGDEEEEAGAVDEHEAEVPPAVAKRRELRLAAAYVQRDRLLADVEVRAHRPDHHLGRELHPGRLEVEPRQRVAADRAEAAVRVADRRPVDEVEEAGEDRVADAAHQRHRARLDVLHPVSHHELRALIELPDEVGDLLEVVREVRVDHDDVVAAGGREAGEVRAPVPAPGLVHDRRAGGGGELGAAVLRAVVDDDHLAREPAVLEDAARPAHALVDVLLLVETGDHDRNVSG